MREYLEKAIDVEMQRFGMFTTLMMASGGGSIGLFLGMELSFHRAAIIIAGLLIALISGLLSWRSYIRVNSLLRELKNV